jgi:hypothetical protein
MPMKKKACIVDIKKKSGKKYLRQPSIDFVAKCKMPSNWKISVT